MATAEHEPTDSDKFCDKQIHTQENPKGYDCAVRLIEGDSAGFAIPYECPYSSAGQAEGTCQDFEPVRIVKRVLEIPGNVILSDN